MLKWINSEKTNRNIRTNVKSTCMLMNKISLVGILLIEQEVLPEIIITMQHLRSYMLFWVK